MGIEWSRCFSGGKKYEYVLRETDFEQGLYLNFLNIN